MDTKAILPAAPLSTVCHVTCPQERESAAEGAWYKPLQVSGMQEKILQYILSTLYHPNNKVLNVYYNFNVVQWTRIKIKIIIHYI